MQPDELETARGQLLKYCGLDTFAMVKIWEKLALIRIWQILKEYSDYDHPITQDDIARYLESNYGIIIERKAISRNISLLKEAGIEIESRRAGS